MHIDKNVSKVDLNNELFVCVTLIICRISDLRLCHTGAIFATNSPKYPKSTNNPIVRWSFQRNRYSSTCTAKSLFAVNRGFNYGSDRHSGVYY